jgi:hypothetical protein
VPVVSEPVDDDEVAGAQQPERMMQHRRAGTWDRHGHGRADDAALDQRPDGAMHEADMAEVAEGRGLDLGEDGEIFGWN